MRVGFSCFLLALALLSGPRPSMGQSLLQQYRDARFEARADEIIRRNGMHARPRPPEHIPSPVDTLAAWWNRHHVEPEPPPPPPAPFERARWRHIKRLEHGWFERSFGDTKWAYSGNARRTLIDTTATPELRARLQSRFGAPTVTLVEAVEDSSFATDPFIQFEYWIVLNDSIPVRIMDVGGPLDRGVVLVSTAAFRERLPALREALQRELFDEVEESAYLDYYFDELTGTWYQSGFDGTRYFTRKISRPVLSRGRPWLPEEH